MISKFFYSGFFIVASIFFLQAQSSHQLLRKGDKAYKNFDYLDAEENYRKADELATDLKSSYNMANSIYEQQRFEEAIEHYQKATELAGESQAKKDAYYNLGNAYFQNGDFENSVKSYKESLKIDENDLDTKSNLFLAQQMLRQMQQQQQQQQQSQENQEQEENEEQEQQNQAQENQEEQENQEQQSKQDPQEQEEESTSGESQEEEQDLSLEDALKLLEVIENEEKKVQEKLRKGTSKKKTTKDW
jgi:tetratricopeptide (TPR) repeat protein